MSKEDQGEKLIQTFIFHKLPNAQGIWRECYVVHTIELFLHQRNKHWPHHPIPSPHDDYIPLLPPLYSFKSHKYNYDKTPYIVSSYP